MTETININLGKRSYPIYVGEHLLTNGDLFEKHISNKKVAIVTNETIAPLYLQKISETFKDINKEIIPIILPDGEVFKNFETLNLIYDELLKNRADRQITLVALGGGVVGDITGFAAATFMRGVDFIQIPTTLLSQVDSSVGGKTGINHQLGKNMIGAFYQPKCVISDISLLINFSLSYFFSLNFLTISCAMYSPSSPYAIISNSLYSFAVSVPATFACEPPITVSLFGNLSLIFLASSVALDKEYVVVENPMIAGSFSTIIL